MKHCLCSVPLQLVDGVLVVPNGSLTGYDSKTGKKIWHIESRELTTGEGVGLIRWSSGSKTYLINGVTCVDPAKGKVVQPRKARHLCP